MDKPEMLQHLKALTKVVEYLTDKSCEKEKCSECPVHDDCESYEAIVNYERPECHGRWDEDNVNCMMCDWEGSCISKTRRNNA